MIIEANRNRSSRWWGRQKTSRWGHLDSFDRCWYGGIGFNIGFQCTAWFCFYRSCSCWWRSLKSKRFLTSSNNSIVRRDLLLLVMSKKTKTMDFDVFFLVNSTYVLISWWLLNFLITTTTNLCAYLLVLSLIVSSMILLDSEEFCNSGLKLICGLLPPSSSTWPLVISVKVPPGVLLVCEEGDTYLAALMPARLGESADDPG